MKAIFGLVVVFAVALAQTSVVEGAHRSKPSFGNYRLNVGSDEDYDNSDEKQDHDALLNDNLAKMDCLIRIMDGEDLGNLQSDWEECKELIQMRQETVRDKSGGRRTWPYQFELNEEMAAVIDSWAVSVKNNDPSLYDDLKSEIDNNCNA